MTVTMIPELGTFYRVTLAQRIPSRKFLGVTWKKACAVSVFTDVIRVRPKDVGLDDGTLPEQVIEELLAMGYKSLSEDAFHQIAGARIETKQAGYMVAPLSDGVRHLLVVQKSGVVVPFARASLPGPVEKQKGGYSVLVARP